MQTRNDGTHVILPAAVPKMRRPDRARLLVTLLRQSDGRVHHDGSRAANKQRNYPVAEDSTAHRNSTPKSGIVAQSIDSCIIVSLKRNDDVRKVI
jgi:hypothetical protein